MYIFPYCVSIFTNKLSDSVCSSLIEDLKKFYVEDVQKISTEAELSKYTEKASKPVICVCSASACFYLLGNAYMKEVPKNLKCLLLFCGPYEGFYSRWSTSCPAVKFLSHNLKEVRRAVIWYLAGGDFSPNGNTIPPPTFDTPTMICKPSLKSQNDTKINPLENISNCSVKEIVNYPLGKSLDYHSGNTTDFQIRNATDCQFRNTTDYLLENSTDYSLENNKDYQLGNTTDYQLEKLIILWHLAACVSNSGFTPITS